MITARLSRPLVYTILTVVTGVSLLPFAWVVFGAFKDTGEILHDPGAWLPKSFGNLNNFVVLFTEKDFLVYFVNSLVVAAVVVIANVTLSSMAGYALSKLRFRGKKLVFGAVMASLMIPVTALFVPQFSVIVQLGLADSLGGIIAPMVVLPLGIFIMQQFASAVPEELIEAARLDGAGEFRVFAQVFVPLLGPATAAVSILTFLAAWNNFLWPLVVAQSESNYTLPVGLAVASQGSNMTEYGVLLAGALVLLLPVLVLYMFLQRHFIQGIAATGLR
ncbi:carbohydrate ABC transporter permease [Arthrobacter sp. S2(2024)]|uniref:carbohydrate ABC transporter permease n=1 Tax=Arthrobacter sp. S2(2024) TaxID=3111911 RepID=UPI002FCAFB0A